MLHTTIDFDVLMQATETDYELQCTTAKLLGISIDEYLDFVRDMAIDTIDYTLEEIEQMYIDYCQEYDISCEQLEHYADYACIDRMGWN